MSAENLFLSTELEATLSQVKMWGQEKLLLPGIIHHAHQQGINYLTLIKNNREQAESVFLKYWKLCHDENFDMWENAIPTEAVFGKANLVDDLESFRTHQCRKCLFKNYKKTKLNPGWNESKKYIYKIYETLVASEYEHRGMVPTNADYSSWVYLCEPCYKRKDGTHASKSL